jgi:Bestrophin, RFP-TM, chloride channel
MSTPGLRTDTRKKAAKDPITKFNIPYIMPNKYNWSELQENEKRRQAALRYVSEPFWKILTHWDGTVWKILIRDFLFWLTMAIYVGVRFQTRYSLPVFISALSSDNMGLIGGFLTFTLAFYVNQNYSRYFSLYQESRNCSGHILDLASLMKPVMPYHRAARILRYLNASHAAAYVGLSNVYTT